MAIMIVHVRVNGEERRVNSDAPTPTKAMNEWEYEQISEGV